MLEKPSSTKTYCQCWCETNVSHWRGAEGDTAHCKPLLAFLHPTTLLCISVANCGSAQRSAQPTQPKWLTASLQSLQNPNPLHSVSIYWDAGKQGESRSKVHLHRHCNQKDQWWATLNLFGQNGSFKFAEKGHSSFSASVLFKAATASLLSSNYGNSLFLIIFSFSSLGIYLFVWLQ